MRRIVTTSLALALMACGGAQTSAPQTTTPTQPESTTTVVVEQVSTKEDPPASGPARDIRFPAIVRTTTANGLEVNTVSIPGLPIAQIKLVIRAGSAADPKDLPGTAQMVAQMLKEGTAKKNSAKIAETVDFLGAHLGIANDEERIVIDMQALDEQLPDALSLVAELATQPTFDAAELAKLKKRELDRLSLSAQSPSFLARREFWKSLYGEHPYSHVDTTKDVVKRIKKSDLAKWHRTYFAPNNAYLIIAGNVQPEVAKQAADKAFKAWAKRTIPKASYPAVPARTARQIVLVDRPESVQSVIYVGDVALERTNPDYVPLIVANQVLGGSAASRLFMDLREKQSLTYGAYSDVDEGVEPSPFRAFAAVRNEVTPQAMEAFMAHLVSIRSEIVPENELTDAKRYLVDSFPLQIETIAEISGLTSKLRLYDFPDDYWDSFRSRIQAVTAEQALAAAQKYIDPDRALIVVVGKAAAVKDALSAYGPVTVVDVDGKVIVSDAPASGTAPTATTTNTTTTTTSAAAEPKAEAAPAAPVPATNSAPKEN